MHQFSLPIMDLYRFRLHLISPLMCNWLICTCLMRVDILSIMQLFDVHQWYFQVSGLLRVFPNDTVSAAVFLFDGVWMSMKMLGRCKASNCVWELHICIVSALYLMMLSVVFLCIADNNLGEPSCWQWHTVHDSLNQMGRGAMWWGQGSRGRRSGGGVVRPTPTARRGGGVWDTPLAYPG